MRSTSPRSRTNGPRASDSWGESVSTAGSVRTGSRSAWDRRSGRRWSAGPERACPGLGPGPTHEPRARYYVPHVQQLTAAMFTTAQRCYCLNGMVMTVQALLERNPQATEEQIRDELRYNLCRCGTHVEIMQAAVRVAKARQ